MIFFLDLSRNDRIKCDEFWLVYCNIRSLQPNFQSYTKHAEYLKYKFPIHSNTETWRNETSCDLFPSIGYQRVHDYSKK